jgi:hypothetical protein
VPSPLSENSTDPKSTCPPSSTEKNLLIKPPTKPQSGTPAYGSVLKWALGILILMILLSWLLSRR